ncbi:hypothetical protein CHF27_010875 [Romboutsia maritimum]|uniref:Uncharacterized protein n=1 Tax=Romboutsia maritimum TaxID=2020948 RepID=A0A371IR21_9FIRM|nr:hypothetical protein [Romboutsia maritimum]RDY22914.1 hypothetical protein CHF27_010875 [Romboutsia maritimum]
MFSKKYLIILGTILILSSLCFMGIRKNNKTIEELKSEQNQIIYNLLKQNVTGQFAKVDNNNLENISDIEIDKRINSLSKELDIYIKNFYTSIEIDKKSNLKIEILQYMNDSSIELFQDQKLIESEDSYRQYDKFIKENSKDENLINLKSPIHEKKYESIKLLITNFDDLEKNITTKPNLLKCNLVGLISTLNEQQQKELYPKMNKKIDITDYVDLNNIEDSNKYEGTNGKFN